jgi:molybdate transport system regulatory protein
MARLTIRVDKTGSIRNAAEAVGMSFRQGWLLLKAIEEMFGQPVITTQRGGPRGGGSKLTDLGRLVVASYRQLERASATAAQKELAVLEKRLDPAAPVTRHRKISRKAPKGGRKEGNS